jgi:hypothetical protein
VAYPPLSGDVAEDLTIQSVEDCVVGLGCSEGKRSKNLAKLAIGVSSIPMSMSADIVANLIDLIHTF